MFKLWLIWRYSSWCPEKKYKPVNEHMRWPLTPPLITLLSNLLLPHIFPSFSLQTYYHPILHPSVKPKSHPSLLQRQAPTPRCSLVPTVRPPIPHLSPFIRPFYPAQHHPSPIKMQYKANKTKTIRGSAIDFCMESSLVIRWGNNRLYILGVLGALKPGGHELSVCVCMSVCTFTCASIHVCQCALMLAFMVTAKEGFNYNIDRAALWSLCDNIYSSLMTTLITRLIQ